MLRLAGQLNAGHGKRCDGGTHGWSIAKEFVVILVPFDGVESGAAHVEGAGQRDTVSIVSDGRHIEADQTHGVGGACDCLLRGEFVVGLGKRNHVSRA